MNSFTAILITLNYIDEYLNLYIIKCIIQEMNDYFTIRV